MPFSTIILAASLNVVWAGAVIRGVESRNFRLGCEG